MEIKSPTKIPSGFQMCSVVNKNQHKIREVEKNKVLKKNTLLSLNSTEVITKHELVCKELLIWHQASGYIPKWCGPRTCTDQSQHCMSPTPVPH